jgi:hypothetical protein
MGADGCQRRRGLSSVGVAASEWTGDGLRLHRGLPAASGVFPIRPMRVSGTARDILLVPEPGTAWRHLDTAMTSPMGRQLTLKGLATRNPTLLFSFVGSLLLRLDARRFLSLLLNEPPRSPRDEPDFFTRDAARVFCRPAPLPASASCWHGSHGRSMSAHWLSFQPPCRCPWSV